MHEKEINLIDVRFIFLRKIASRECVLRGPKMLKIDFSWGCWVGGPMSLAIWPKIFRLLGHRPTDQKFQNDHCLICQFWVLPMPQQIKILCQKYGQMGYNYLTE